MINFLVHNMMLPILNFSYHNIIPNYGLAILLVTLFIKAIFYPITKKQFEAMKANQTVQPLISKMREKYKDDPKKQQKEMMKIWKEHKMNPLSGCLPVLIQMPFFIAMFYTIRSPEFVQIISAPGINSGLFSFWLTDLSQPDKTFILPLIVGVSTYFSQKMMPMDPKQAAMFMFMPFVMFAICLKMPAGVLLFWATTQVLSAAQQYYTLKQAKAADTKEDSNNTVTSEPTA